MLPIECFAFAWMFCRAIDLADQLPNRSALIKLVIVLVCLVLALLSLTGHGWSLAR